MNKSLPSTNNHSSHKHQNIIYEITETLYVQNGNKCFYF